MKQIERPVWFNNKGRATIELWDSHIKELGLKKGKGQTVLIKVREAKEE